MVLLVILTNKSVLIFYFYSDQLDGTRLRFVCGHSACGDCVATATECPTCSPLMESSSTRAVPDEHQTERVKHASELLTSFQDAFQIDGIVLLP